MGARSFTVAGLALALVLAGLGLRSGSVLALAIPVLVFGLAGVYRLLGQTPPHVELMRSLSARRVSDGQIVTVTLECRHLGPRAMPLVLRDVLPVGLQLVEGRVALARLSRPGDVCSLQYQVRAPRGLYRWQRVEVSSRDALSAAAFERSMPCASSLWSLPRAEPIRALPIAPRRTRVFSGIVKARRGGDGVEFFSTRPYAWGDEMRRMHWKASARIGQWITTQFEQERVADVAIVLDARRRSNVDDGAESADQHQSLFEFSVRAAASVAQFTLAQGNRVGLLHYGRALEWTYPGHGNRQRERMFQALACARLGDKSVFEGFEYLPQKLFPARSQLILVSPLVPGDVEALRRLRAHGHYLTVISPNPVLFEARLVPQSLVRDTALRLALLERRSMLHALRRSWITVVDWDTDKPLSPQLHKALAAVKP